jgi:hypothetical protein
VYYVIVIPGSVNGRIEKDVDLIRIGSLETYLPTSIGPLSRSLDRSQRANGITCLMYNSIDTSKYANLPHRNVAESLIRTPGQDVHQKLLSIPFVKASKYIIRA